MKEWTKIFDTSDADTCMQKWTFGLREEDGKIAITSLEIERENQGCQGHPKTISAFAENAVLDSINIDALKKTDCPRGRSCGQVFADCVEAIING